MAKGDITLPNQTGTVDPRLTVSRPANPVRRKPTAPARTTADAARSIQSTFRKILGGGR